MPRHVGDIVASRVLHPHPCYSAATVASHRSLTSEPSYSSPRGLPLSRLPRLRVVPFLGLAVVHRRGALGLSWSMWSTTDFHRKSTVCGGADSWVHAAARKCLLITRKIIIPPPDSGAHWTGHLISQKTVSPLTAGTHRTGHRISRKKRSPRCQLRPTGSASLLRIEK